MGKERQEVAGLSRFGRVGLAVAAAMVALGALQARAEPGDVDSPLIVPGYPFEHHFSTVGRNATIDRYSCATATSEEGPEVAYQVPIDAPGRLTATVEGDDGTVDIDVQILTSLSVDSSGTARDCLDRNNRSASAEVSEGPAFVVVDSYQGAHRAGPYRLRVDLQPTDDWYEREIARGVALQTRVYPELFGGRQTGSVLRLDGSDPELRIRMLGGAGCVTTSHLGEEAGAVAAVNAGFFELGSCASVSLLKVDGELLYPNQNTRSAFGIGAGERPMIALIPAGQDWPEAVHAVGGVPRLVSDGEVDVRAAEEGVGGGFVSSRHPRTAVGITAEGDVLLATFDGRTDAGAGVSLADLAQWLVDLGADQALNLDGGGSTTLWAAGEPFDGVVNYPSDNGTADHAGERAVGSAIGVFAAPLDRPVEWLTAPSTEVVGESESWVYDLVAADPEGGPIALSVAADTAGTVTLDEEGMGQARLVYEPVWPDGRDGPVVIELEAYIDGELSATQVLMLEVQYLDEGDGGDTGGPDAGGADEDAGTEPPERPDVEVGRSQDVSHDDLAADSGSAPSESQRVTISEGCGCTQSRRPPLGSFWIAAMAAIGVAGTWRRRLLRGARTSPPPGVRERLARSSGAGRPPPLGGPEARAPSPRHTGGPGSHANTFDWSE